MPEKPFVIGVAHLEWGQKLSKQNTQKVLEELHTLVKDKKIKSIAVEIPNIYGHFERAIPPFFPVFSNLLSEANKLGVKKLIAIDSEYAWQKIRKIKKQINFLKALKTKAAERKIRKLEEMYEYISVLRNKFMIKKIKKTKPDAVFVGTMHALAINEAIPCNLKVVGTAKQLEDATLYLFNMRKQFRSRFERKRKTAKRMRRFITIVKRIFKRK